MKDFKQLLKELPSSTIVCAMGEFDPPTVGHEILVKTVKRLAEKPQKMNPTRSFEKYISHLKLLKRISELIWDNPDRYSAETIV